MCIRDRSTWVSSVDPTKVLNLGCYHMRYYLDGNLLAVGVVDIFPTGLSSVYFFYDPAYQKLALGIIGSLKEIEWVKEQQKYFPDFKYYYLGYYIQDCKKMVYKAEYEPSELLCPVSYTYCRLTPELRKQIDEGKRVRLSPDNVPTIPDMNFGGMNIEKFIKEKSNFEIQGSQVHLSQLNRRFQEVIIPIMKTLVTLWGMKLSQNIIITSVSYTHLTLPTIYSV
eukprot:TRINITY_DN19943_c0_g1_i1.p1 TRINITY_DN19943_c0_g1~~TRINITY_DN19943_c0_g1_i1.p1  ORF type:complete len:243 (+),score=65.99 TRINITY_DN19943_c0_g1_i1:60-731(+)